MLEKRGVYITSHCLTVKMNNTYDHEEYFDDIQRYILCLITSYPTLLPLNPHSVRFRHLI